MMLVTQFSIAAQYMGGDLAPSGGDGVLDVTDVAVLESFVSGTATPTQIELKVADVYPESAPDGVLDANDVLTLQAAVDTAVTLASVAVLPDAPVLTAGVSPTSQNPYLISGTATKNSIIKIYVNGIYQQDTFTGVTDEVFSSNVVLNDGLNSIYATVFDGVDESLNSNEILVEYNNTISRVQGGIISVDTVWTAGSVATPYVVQSSLTIQSGVKLIIQPGVEVKFNSGTNLMVNGTLQAKGSVTSPVKFISNVTPTQGSWGGIIVNGPSSRLDLDYSHIKHAANGLLFVFTEGRVSNSLLESNTRGAMITSSSPVFISNTIKLNSIGIHMSKKSSPIFREGNFIVNNMGHGIVLESDIVAGQYEYPTPHVNGNSIHSNGVNDVYIATDFPPNAPKLNFKGNWWGTISIDEIGTKLWDYNDSLNASAFIDFSYLLDSEGGLAIIDNYLIGMIEPGKALIPGVVYKALGDIVIPTGSSLIIPAGVKILFGSKMDLLVDGTLRVEGSPALPVEFTTTNPLPVKNSWTGVRVSSTATNVVLDYVQIRYAKEAIRFESATGLVSNSVLENNTAAIYINHSSPTITGNFISSNNNGIFMLGNSLPIINNGNSITNNSTHGLYLGGLFSSDNTYPLPKVNGNSIYSNGYLGAVNVSTTGYNYISTPPNIDFKGNWWGTAVIDDIATTIRDFTDNQFGTAVVDYGGFLIGENGSASLDNYLSGVISVHTTLPSGTVYKALGDLVVAQGATLTISDGVRIEFGADMDLTVNGVVNVFGNALAPVEFTSNKAIPSKNDWAGIKIDSGLNYSLINYANISYAVDGVSFNSSQGLIGNSIIENNTTGILLTNSSPTISANKIRLNTDGMKIMHNSNPVVNNGNEIVNNSRYGMYLHGNTEITSTLYPLPKVNGNKIHSNSVKNVFLESYRSRNGAYFPKLDFTGNWWGTTVIDSIADKIYDFNDSAIISMFVDYSGFLSAENGLPVTDNHLVGVFDLNTTLVSGRSYKSLGKLVVPLGGSLTIPEGVSIEFGENMYLEADGSLIVNGTTAAPVLFSSTSPLANPDKSSWGGIVINNQAGKTVDINYAHIKDARFGVFTSFDGGAIRNSIIENCLRGIYLSSSSMSILGNTIKLNQDGIFMHNDSSPQISNGNKITDNSFAGIYMVGYNALNNPYPKPQVNGNSIHSNPRFNIYTFGFTYDPLVEIPKLNFSGNWWGSTIIDTIAEGIIDYTDNSTNNNTPFIDYSDFLNAESGVPIIDNYLLGRLDVNTTLVRGKAYKALGDIIVPQDVILTIPADVSVQFGKHMGISVDGTLSVNGEKSLPVLFTTTNSTPVKGSWEGISVRSASTNTSINYANIEYALNGVIFGEASGRITNSVIENNNIGLYAVSASPAISGNMIRKNNKGILLYKDSSPLIYGNNIITENIVEGIELFGQSFSTTDAYPRPVVNGNSIYNNLGNNVSATNYYYSAEVPVIDFTGNWWGTSIETEISLGIHDFSDSMINTPIIDYVAYLDGPPLSDGTWQTACYEVGDHEYQQEIVMLTGTSYYQLYVNSALSDCTSPWSAILKVYNYSVVNSVNIASSGALVNLDLLDVQLIVNDQSALDALNSVCSIKHLNLSNANKVNGMTCGGSVIYPIVGVRHYELLKLDVSMTLGNKLDVINEADRAATLSSSRVLSPVTSAQ